jgi:hypothetical protein
VTGALTQFGADGRPEKRSRLGIGKPKRDLPFGAKRELNGSQEYPQARWHGV